jgi:putative serine protease PepD
MSDDLFWPPLSGGEDDASGGEADAGSRPTQSYPTAPYAASAGATSSYPTSEPGQPAESAYSTGGSPGGDKRRLGTASVVAVTAFVFGLGGVAVGAKALNGGNTTVISSGSGVSTATASALTTNPKSYAAIAARVLPSVVSINVTGANESDTGSGIILRSDGYILTNNHVVAAAANGGSVSVSLNDGSTASAKIIGTDSLDDLAVIKIARTGLSAATLGNSSALAVGDPVLAVGSPLGLTGTVTAGIVSALNRPVETEEESQQGLPGFGGGSSASANPTVIDAIQTDAAINPGNSGGALVDAAGDVVGINSAIASLGSDSLSGSQSGNIGVGFAIPINEAKTIATELINTGHASHPLLGVELKPVTASTGVERAVVAKVDANSPASRVGIEAGDVITAIDGTATPGVDAVIASIRTHQPGQQITVTVERGGSTKTFTATLATESSSQE